MHYLPPCPEGRDGSRFETVDACVECFNIPAFLEQFDRIGAEWLIFTIGQNTGMYNAPCEVIEKLAGPGHCAKRDLVGELALALHRAGKHFIAYLPMEAHANPIRRQLGWVPDSPEHPVSPQRAFQKNWLEVVAEWSLRYGRLIDGWFFDGGYCLIQTRAERTALFAAARAGNSDAAVSLNYGGFDIWDVPLIFEDEDYFSGEATMLKNGLPLAHWRDRSTLTAGELGLPASEGAHPVSQPYCPGRASVPGFPGVLMHALVPVDSFWYRKADVAWLKENRSLQAIIVTGCLAERYQRQILEELPEVDAVLGVGSYHHIVEAVESVLRGEKYLSFEDKNTSPLGGERIVTTPEYTAYLKVAEGCDNRCTYCAIPLIRGRFRSRPIEELVEEAKELEAIGVKELNLIAQDTTRYGMDLYGKYCLPELIRAICEATDIPWIRILYCYPDKITDELVEEIKNNDRVVKYIDLPIQHISDRILAAMNRHGDAAMIRSVVEKLRREIPDICIRTTVIVGFPGETEEDFYALCEYISEVQFDRLGAFPYSREEDTPAYDFEEQIDEQVKQDRYDIVMREQLHITQRKNEEMIGKRVTVLCEAFDPVAEIYYGRSAHDAPDIDTKVYFRNAIGKKRIAPGTLVEVEIEEAMDYDLIGRTIL